ncbi:MAG: type VI secretion system ATPase TssH, partial [Gemmatimonadales bacterium]
IMTSNLGGSHIVEAGPTVDEASWAVVDRAVRNELRHHFRPEFLNRVDDIIVFRPLSRDNIRHIVDLQLQRLAQLLADRKLGLEVTEGARQLLSELGYDPVYGARPLKRVIQQRLQNPIALEVLEGRYPEGATIRVERDGDDLVFTSAAQGQEAAGA